MNRYSLSHLADRTLLDTNKRLREDDRATTADLLAHIAETDARKLYRPEGYPSLFHYCVHELGFSEDEAGKRVHAARAARRFPMIFPALADGRLHLTAVNRLRPHLTETNATELIKAASGKTRSEIQQILAERFPQPDVPTRVRALPSLNSADRSDIDPGSAGQSPAVRRTELELIPLVASASVPSSGGAPALEQVHRASVHPEPAPEQVSPVSGELQPALKQVQISARPARVTPLAPQRFALQLTMSQRMHDKLRRTQALLGHRVPSGDVTQVLELALDALLKQLEKQKFAKTDRPRKSKSAATSQSRRIPAAVKRAVWERDCGRCSFLSVTGKRCQESGDLEYDHIVPVARGGTASVSQIRLLCRAHNQLAAECEFGPEFVRRKRTAARSHDQPSGEPRADSGGGEVAGAV